MDNHTRRFRLSNDKLAMESLREMVQELAVRANQEFVADSFPDWYLDKVLELHNLKSAAAWDALRRSQMALEQLREMEQRADTNLLRALFQEGAQHVRGRDRIGRPILWMGASESVHRAKAPYTELLLYNAWVSIWALRCRSEELMDRSVFVVYDSRGQNLMNFNSGYFNAYGALFSALSPLFNPGGETWVFLPNILFRAPLRILERLWSKNAAGEAIFRFASTQEEILQQVQDRENVPRSFHHLGRELVLNFETYGNFDELLERRAFASLEIRDIFNARNDSIHGRTGDTYCSHLSRAEINHKFENSFASRGSSKVNGTSCSSSGSRLGDSNDSESSRDSSMPIKTISGDVLD
uniref:CRAL-TRIO domain-containing protein n=1 Tax=Compsopogon caeruleus TaxID=31354 RepID=A0A7S1T919_9RHOD|mmetsp:Transcript_13433/g.27411  ORF Transcript_13433/g.27411 Transcript_13433/m.27411 type:complete len:354 (+) Transcript_13433:271-1332(+)